LVNLRSVPNSGTSLGWVIGHDNGGFDRSLNLTDGRYGSGVAGGTGVGPHGSSLIKLKNNLNSWHCVAVSYDKAAKKATFYADGLTQTVFANPGSGASNATLGGLENFTNHTVDALVDEVFMFNRVLSKAEINQVCTDLSDPTIEVDIDIKPGSDSNPINLNGKGVIPVAILTTDDFNATDVNASSVRFGPGMATEAHEKAHWEDVNGDSRADLVLHFRIQETDIVKGNTEACLTGETNGGTPIEGCDSIQIKGKN